MGANAAVYYGIELQRRITQLTAPNSITAFSRACEWISSSGSYVFDLLGNWTSPPADSVSVPDDPTATFGEVTLPGDCDLKKAIFVTNTTGLPVIKVPFNRLWESFGLNNPVDQGFTTFVLTGDKLLLRPNQSVGSQVGVRYHKKFVPLQTGDFSRMPDYLDELACDLAEAEERRIYSVGDQWVKTRDDTRLLILKSLDGWHSTSQEPMPLEEATGAIQEQLKIGRA